MRTLKRDKKPLYLCSKILNSEPQQFQEPKEIYLNTVATTTEADIKAFGDNYKQYRRATVPIEKLSEFQEGDRAYIFVQKPEVHDKLCTDCDFEIYSVSDSVSQGVIMFKRLQIGNS